KRSVASACPVSCTSTTSRRNGASHGALQNQRAASTRAARRKSWPRAREERGREGEGTRKGPGLRTSRAVPLFHRWLACLLRLHSSGAGDLPELPDSVLLEPEPPVPAPTRTRAVTGAYEPRPLSRASTEPLRSPRGRAERPASVVDYLPVPLVSDEP